MGKKKVNRFSIPAGQQEEKIERMLKMLELEGAISSFGEINKRIHKNQGTHFDFFESVLEKEIMYREEYRQGRWKQLAKFPFKKTLMEFDFLYQPSINQEQINELASCRFIKQGNNVIFLGPAGVGKTHLSIALGLEAIDRGYETRFLRLDQLIDIVENSDEEFLPKVFRNLLAPKLLILDDIDFYNTGKNASTFLFKLALRRYENKVSTIYTSNKGFSEWEGLFGDARRASAALDRILDRAIVMSITGDSYRVKDKLKEPVPT